MTSLASSLKQNSLLLKCLVVSGLGHIAVLLYFYTHPILLHGPWQSLFGLSSATPELLSYEEEALGDLDRMLKETFQHVIVLPHHLQSPLDLVEFPRGIPLAPTREESVADPLALEQTNLFRGEDASQETFVQTEELFMTESLEIEPLFVPAPLQFEIASQLDIDTESSLAEAGMLPLPFDEEIALESREWVAVQDLSLEALAETDSSGINLLDCAPPLAFDTASDAVPLKRDPRSQLGKIASHELDATAAAATVPLFVSPSLSETFHSDGKREIALSTELPALEEYDLPTLTTASAWNDDFDAHLQFFPKEEGKGYTFSVSLTPTFDISQYSLKQNIYFILDRSNSVQRHRFAVFKRAVVKALASMQTGESFNIYVVDKKITRLSPSPLKISAKALRSAEEFLDKQEAGGHFATADIYSMLDQLLPDASYEDEIHTAILLTDGNSSLSSSKQQRLLTKWLEKNNSTLSLYTAAVGQQNNLVMLDLLSSISGGRLLYSDTHASFPRKLAKLILDLRNPIISDMLISAIPDNPQAHIEIHTPSSHLPTLYSHQPYLIVGTIDKPCNFDLILQGRHGEEWISIKKTLSFTEADRATRSQAKKWDAHEANLHYARFLKEGKADQLKTAKEILQNARTEIAFE